MAVASKLIAGIDTSRCRKDFQLAWFDLGVAAQKASQPKPNSDDAMALRAVVELASGVGAAHVALTTLPQLFAKSEQKHQEAREAQDAFTDALSNVKCVAIQHGVLFHPVNP